MSAQASGRYADAEAAYRKVLALRSDVAEVHHNLGCVLHAQGRLDEAAECYRRAMALKENYADAHSNLANIFRARGRPDEAAKHYERALALRPDCAEFHNNIGALLKDQNNLDEAAARFTRAIALKPGYADPHNNLGNVCQDQGKLEEAVLCYERALALNPAYAEAHQNLGQAQSALGRCDEAETEFRRALALRPDYIEAHVGLGNVLREQGKIDEALSQCQRAVALSPDWADAHNNLANVFKDLGRFDEAARHYDRALELKPDLVEALYNRADLKTYKAGDGDLSALEALAANADHLPEPKRHFIHFALAKALDDIGDYASAFEQMSEANALRRRMICYDEPGTLASLEQIAQVFDARFFQRVRASGNASQVPIFIVGMPRSGSTLIEQILARHPLVHAAGEVNALHRVATQVTDADGQLVPYPNYVASFGADDFARIAQDYLARLPALPPGKSRMTDKLLANFIYVGLIRLILPNARIIHAVRDPLDTCFSCFSRLFTAGITYAYDLGELGRFYLAYQKLMAHWRSVLPPDAMLDVVYEDVVENLEQQARRLIDYCGLPWDERCLDFHRAQRPVSTSSSVQVRRPLYRSSLQRWRQYEAFLQPLLDEIRLRAAFAPRSASNAAPPHTADGNGVEVPKVPPSGAVSR
ncbi:MAG TPA: tetratricopeptide repeat protein [Humisphaera sp.]|nr:tetratricopeptide repeat protein [Humisphaera sp.]